MSDPGTTTKPSPTLRVETLGVRESTRFLSELVDLYLQSAVGLPNEDARVVQTRLAIVEALTNVVRHAYKGREPGPLVLELAFRNDELEVVLSDEGPAFDPFASPDVELPRPEDLATNGYGRGIIRTVMDAIEHHPGAETGNRLVLRKRLPLTG